MGCPHRRAGVPCGPTRPDGAFPTSKRLGTRFRPCFPYLSLPVCVDRSYATCMRAYAPAHWASKKVGRSGKPPPLLGRGWDEVGWRSGLTRPRLGAAESVHHCTACSGAQNGTSSAGGVSCMDAGRTQRRSRPSPVTHLRRWCSHLSRCITAAMRICALRSCLATSMPMAYTK